jgi:ABC-2 type transport system ATP-binding protein
MADPMIEVRSLTKYYGDFLAVDDLSFSVDKGEIAGLLGSNGSGKTTTMRILTGYLPETSGSARVAGFDVATDSIEVRRRVGYLPEATPLYLDMTVTDYLHFMGRLHGLDRATLRRRVGDVIEACQITSYAATPIGRLSKGYRQRVGIARAILHEPPVLILDEPTIGLDPAQVVETRGLIRELGKAHTVLLSTHILAEVNALCQKVVILHEGSLVAAGTPAELSEKLNDGARLELEVRGPAAEVCAALGAIGGVRAVEHRTGDLYYVSTQAGVDLRDSLSRAVIERGWPLLRLTPVSLGIEEIFLRLTDEDRGH